MHVELSSGRGSKATTVFCHLVRLLREELQLLQEQGSYVGEVVRAMDKKKVLVKVKAEWGQHVAYCTPTLFM